MADLKKINGYDLKDEVARNLINELSNNKADKVEIPSIAGLASESYVRAQIAAAQLGGGTVVAGACVHGINVKDYGAVGDGSTDDTSAFLAALETKSEIYVPEGNYVINQKLRLSPWQVLTISKRAILHFQQSEGICIEMGYQTVLQGGIIEVPLNFAGSAVAYCSDLAVAYLADCHPFTGNRNDVMTRHRAVIRDIIIQKAVARPWYDTDISGYAIELRANNVNVSGEALWGVLIDNISINGGFDTAVWMHTIQGSYEEANYVPWLHDTVINGLFAQYPKRCFLIEDLNFVYINGGAFQPQTAFYPYESGGTKYVTSGADIYNCTGIVFRDFAFWDTNFTFVEGREWNVVNTYGRCNSIIFHDIGTAHYSDDMRISERRFHYDTLETLLSSKWITTCGEYIFPEIANYKRIEYIHDMEKYPHPRSEVACIDYAIPIYPNRGLWGVSKDNPLYVRLGTITLPTNAVPETYNLVIEEYSYDRVQGYSNISFATDENGNASVYRRLQCLNNANPNLFVDYGFEQEQDGAGGTIVTLYRIYNHSWQDAGPQQRYLRMKNSNLFVTNILVGATPSNIRYATEELGGLNVYSAGVPMKAPVGYCYFSEELGRPVWCKTAAVYNEYGALVSAAVWVNSNGEVVNI